MVRYFFKFIAFAIKKKIRLNQYKIPSLSNTCPYYYVVKIKFDIEMTMKKLFPRYISFQYLLEI